MPGSKASLCDSILRQVTLLASVGLIYLQENMLQGVKDNLVGAAVACFIIARQTSSRAESALPQHWRVDSHTIALAVAIPFALLDLSRHEWHATGDFGFRGRVLLLVCNIPAVAIALSRGFGSAATELSDETSLTCFEAAPTTLWMVISCAFVVFVELDNRCAQQRPRHTSSGQWLAFTAASLTTFDVNETITAWTIPPPAPRDAKDTESEAEALLQEQDEQDYSNQQAVGNNGFWPTTNFSLSLTFHAVLTALMLVLMAYFTVTHCSDRAQHFRRTARDAQWDLDVVVARYDEPLEGLSEALAPIFELPSMFPLKKRVILYNKGGDELDATRLAAWFPLAEHLEVRTLENDAGREGGTYLSHVLTSRDDLAEHTLFMQADPHEKQELRARIRQYFVKETGFLSLAYIGNFCSSCERCGDFSGTWQANGSLLRPIFAQSNLGAVCQDISLTYRGQFIVSKQRIEANEPSVYEDLRDRLSKADISNHGSFGYTLERLWGVVFRCPAISASCPSLFSGLLGTFAPDGISACQCFD